MPLLTANQPPPEGYYAENLTAVIDTVYQQYEDLLSAEESKFAHSTLGLSTSALRLFARLLSRTKIFIRLDSLSYPDVDDIDIAIEELSEAELISVSSDGDSNEILNLLTVVELNSLFPQWSRFGRKAERVDAIQSHLDEVAIRRHVCERFPWLHVTSSKQFEFFCLLFFGNSMQRLDEFVIRDLGVTQFEEYELDPSFRLFGTRQAIDRYQELTELAERVETLGKTITSDEVNTICTAISARDEDRVFELKRSRVLNALGRNLERAEQHELALECYRSSTVHPARERTMRILKKEGRTADLEQVRLEILNAPRSFEEHAFAQRFGRPKSLRQEIKIRTGVSDLKQSEKIESFAAQLLVDEGAEAWHLENLLPNGLFALAYWDWLYAPVRGAFVNPFQATPLDLHWPEFFDIRREICSDPLDEPSKLKSRILATADRKRGISNSLVAWSILTPTLLDSILNAMTTAQLFRLLSIAIQDLRQFRAGFPDLTVIDERGEIAFVEVKGPGDQLRPNQRIWIERLIEEKFNVYVWRFK